jgi:hypothetical protein
MKAQRVCIPSPDLQVRFSLSLQKIRKECLQDALCETVRSLDISLVDKELAELARGRDLSSLAGRGLRGELVFAVPCILASNPRLLGYYRLLLGFSQKTFYAREFGTSSFKSMEEDARLTSDSRSGLPALCKALISAASSLLAGIGVDRITRELLDDLTLLTLGPQLRGGANVRKGAEGIEIVFEAIHRIVKKHCLSTTPQKIELKNAAKRCVLIEFAPDPDIVIREVMFGEAFRNIIAIEVKGGTDFSNIHNRLGEAEKSHQKARKEGFVECWTVVNVDRLDYEKAFRESPSTNRFYCISQIISQKGDEYADFRKRVISLTGIPGK